MRSNLEDTLSWQIKLVGLPPPEREFRFDAKRRWRLDFAWPEQRMAVEVDGGMWVRGAHTRGRRIAQDHEKRNHLTLAGWRVLVFTGDQVKSGKAVNGIQSLLAQATFKDFVFG
jgi:very-short-patch-repair endonuclease